MTFLRRTAFFLLLVMDMHLNAEAIFYPKNCWGKSPNCAVENDSKGSMSLQLKGLSIHMDAQTVVKSISESEADLTRGTLFAQHDEEFRWRTPFGEVLCKNCEVLLQRDEKSLEVHAIRGKVAIIRKGDDEQYDLPPGFSVQLSSIGSDGRGNLDFPQASPLVLVGKEWAKVHSEDAAEFKKEFGAYIEAWQQAADLSSDMQQKEASRVIAAEAADQRRVEQAHALRLKEQERIRGIFKEKNYLQ